MNDKKKIEVVAAAIFNGKEILVGKRSEHQTNSGLWEFPGGKIEVGESAVQALQREILEELSCCIQVGSFIAKSTVSVQDTEIAMSVFAASLEQGTPNNLEHEELRWIAVEQFSDLQWAPADVPILEEIQAYFIGQVR